MSKQPCCPSCGTTLICLEDVAGTFEYAIADDGTIDFNEKSYEGDSSTYLYCTKCEEGFGYVIDDDDVISVEKDIF